MNLLCFVILSVDFSWTSKLMGSFAFGVVSCRIRLNCVGILDVLNYDADTVVQQYQVLNCSLIQNRSLTTL